MLNHINVKECKLKHTNVKECRLKHTNVKDCRLNHSSVKECSLKQIEIKFLMHSSSDKRRKTQQHKICIHSSYASSVKSLQITDRAPCLSLSCQMLCTLGIVLDFRVILGQGNMLSRTLNFISIQKFHKKIIDDE